MSRLSRKGKRELMAQARAAGWRGHSYKKAKRFDQALTRTERAKFIKPEPIGSRARRHVARLIKRGGR